MYTVAPGLLCGGLPLQNPLAVWSSGLSAANVVISEADKLVSFGGGGGWHHARINLPKSSGLSLVEIEVVSKLSTDGVGIGVAPQTASTSDGSNAGTGGRRQYFSESGRKRAGGTYETYEAGSPAEAYVPGDIIGIALDATTPASTTITMYKNGVSLGVMYTFDQTAEPNSVPYISVYHNAGTSFSASFRIKERLTYPPPAGYSVW